MVAVIVSLLLGLTAGWAPAVASVPMSAVPVSPADAVVSMPAGDTATTTSSTTSTTTPVVEAPDIIPEPNSGVAPTDPGDRGGALQTTIFVLIVASVVLIGVLVYRESRKARDRRGF